MEKKEIRKQIYKKRKALSQERLIMDSHRICEQIQDLDAYQKADCIYAYMDCKGEVSTRMLIEAAWCSGKRVAVPKVEGENLVFYYISSYDDLENGYFQIPEPVTRRIAKEESALLIVPGVAFDKKKHRCGYGKGFYDRYLSRHDRHLTIGVAFDFQILEEIPAEEHDILPQCLCTETRWI